MTKPTSPPGLAVGDSYYQVLEPSPERGEAGEVLYGMVGPFADLAAASNYAQPRPGSFITVTLILHEAKAAPPPIARKP